MTDFRVDLLPLFMPPDYTPGAPLDQLDELAHPEWVAVREGFPEAVCCELVRRQRRRTRCVDPRCPRCWGGQWGMRCRLGHDTAFTREGMPAVCAKGHAEDREIGDWPLCAEGHDVAADFAGRGYPTCIWGHAEVCP